MGSRNKVGGWTNPFEKCARQIGFILQNDQVKIQNIWNPKMVWSRWEHPFPRGPYSHVPADNLPIYDSKNAVLNASKRKQKHHLVYDSLKLTVRTYKPSAIPKKGKDHLPTNQPFIFQVRMTVLHLHFLEAFGWNHCTGGPNHHLSWRKLKNHHHWTPRAEKMVKMVAFFHRSCTNSNK